MREILGQNQESGDQYAKSREQELAQLGEELSRKLTLEFPQIFTALLISPIPNLKNAKI